MPLPAAIPLAELLASGIGALGVGEGIKKILKNIPEQNTPELEDTFKRLFLGPSVLPRTIDTPSGKVFAPDEPTPAKPNILATYPQSKDQPWIMGSPIPTGEPEGIMGLPMPETQDKLKGFEKPQDVDTSVLMNEITPENIQKQIKYKKDKTDSTITNAYLDNKLIAVIQKREDMEKVGNSYDYTINWANENGEIDYTNPDIETGLNGAKYVTALGFVNNSKQKEKEYLNNFINAVENKDYTTFDKIRNYDFEDSKFRSKEFKDTLIKYIPKVVDLHRQEAIDRQEAIEETLNKPSNPVGSLIDKPLSDETN